MFVPGGGIVQYSIDQATPDRTNAASGGTDAQTPR
jgi:hypothetical protein